MSSTSVTIPTFARGVSQQSPQARPPGFVGSMRNALPVPVYGAARRPGTDHIATLDVEPSEQARWITFDQGPGNRYMARVVPGDIRVFDLDGAEYPVVGAPTDDPSVYDPPDFTYTSGRTFNALENPEAIDFDSATVGLDLTQNPPWKVTSLTADPIGTPGSVLTGFVVTEPLPAPGTAEALAGGPSVFPDGGTAGLLWGVFLSPIGLNNSTFVDVSLEQELAAAYDDAATQVFVSSFFHASPEGAGTTHVRMDRVGVALAGVPSPIAGQLVSVQVSANLDLTSPDLYGDAQVSVVGGAGSSSDIVEAFGKEQVGNGWFRLWAVVNVKKLLVAYPELVGQPMRYQVFGAQTLVQAGTLPQIYAWGAQLRVDASSFVPYFTFNEPAIAQAGNRLYFLNRDVPPVMSDSTAPGLSFKSALLWIKAGAFETSYAFSIELSEPDGSNPESISVFVKTPDVTGQNGVGGQPGVSFVSQFPNDIAAALEYEITQADTNNRLAVSRFNNVLWVRVVLYPGGSPTQGNVDGVSFTDSQGSTLSSLVYERVKTEDDLPSIGPDGFVVEIEGDETIQEDDWYAVFAPNAGAPVFGALTQGEWVETAEPGSLDTIDATTMPHVLERAQDDIAGSVSGAPYGVFFSWRGEDWRPRLAGDDTTNALPSFVNTGEELAPKTIEAIFIVDGRLGLASGTSFVLSESGDLSNFFRTTVRSLVPSDRIDAQLGDKRAGRIRNAEVDNFDVILMTDRADFVLRSEGAFTPQTIESRFLFEFEKDTSIPPGRTERSILVPFQSGSYAGLRELIRTDEQRPYEPFVITEAVPYYITGRIGQMVTSTTARMTFIRTIGTSGNQNRTNRVWVRSYRWNGQGMSGAWCDMTVGARTWVRHMVSADDKLFLVLERGGSVVLEKMQLELEAYRFKNRPLSIIDGKIRGDAATITGVSFNGISTTFVLPYEIADTADDVRVVHTIDSDEPIGTVVEAGKITLDLNDKRTIAVQGDFSGEKRSWLEFGRKVETRIELTQPIEQFTAADGALRPRSSGFLTSRRLTLEYDMTGAFRVETTPEGRSTYSSVFSVPTSANPRLKTGTYQTSASGRADQLKVEIVADGVEPAFFVAGEWLCQRSPR